jgi:hypothetical protein
LGLLLYIVNSAKPHVKSLQFILGKAINKRPL